MNDGICGRFVSPPRPETWKDVAARDWNNWVWQQQHRITSIEQLSRVIAVTDEERRAYEQTQGQFRMGITPYYASLMDPEDAGCPIRRQAVPSAEELHSLPADLDDPLGEERDMPVPGLTHRYPDRVLLYTIHHCPVYCRHCTRKRKVSDPSSAAGHEQLERALAYIASHREVRDVVISGGDPLSLSDARLEDLLRRLRAMPHIEIFRIGTRNPVTLPQRVTPGLADMLKQYQPVFVHVHFNHPRECTREAFEACARLADAVCVINNQMVLLKGINDAPDTVKALNHRLLMMRVQPYYIFQCDLARGISHFRTPIDTGLEIIAKLRGWTSGMAVPHFVIDAPGGGGKIPLLPESRVARDGKRWILRNYQGNRFEYIEP
jgi:lysine 2,3-aminomutase